jgi:hypothetical protein
MWKKYRGFVLEIKDYRAMLQHLFKIYALRSTVTVKATAGASWRDWSDKEIREIIDDFYVWNEREMFVGRLVPLHAFLLWIKYTLIQVEGVILRQDTRAIFNRHRNCLY